MTPKDKTLPPTTRLQVSYSNRLEAKNLFSEFFKNENVSIDIKYVYIKTTNESHFQSIGIHQIGFNYIWKSSKYIIYGASKNTLFFLFSYFGFTKLPK